MADMISYVTIGADDTDAATKFYDAALGALGHKQLWRNGTWVGYGPDADNCKIMVCGPADGQPARHGNGVMVGFHADNAAQVDAFHAAAMANGGRDEGAPGPRPDYGAGYYLAYVRDPTGNKLSAFFKG